MKKIMLSVFVISAFLMSCSNSEKKAETTDAQEVEVSQSESATPVTTIKEGSHITWGATHLAGTAPRYGKVSLKSAEFLVDNGTLANATILMDMASLTVENFPEGDEQIGKLTGHLLSDDFFKVSTYPTSKFELTNIETMEGDFDSNVTGNLTMLDQTKSITFSANVTISGNEVSIQSEDFSVDRQDWGLSYHTEGEEGVPTDYLIADDIAFKIDVTLTK